MENRPRILIADDEKGYVEVLATALELNGYQVVKAFDGEECLMKAHLESFNLILLDVHMPKLDGYEVIKNLTQIPHLKHTPVVFLTGYNTTPDNIAAGYLYGGTEYWKKPLSPEELEVRVSAILKIATAEKKMREMEEGFTSMIVHDLRSPLSGIAGFAEMLSEDRANIKEEHGEMIDEIGKAAKSMLNIVSDFLEITRLDAGDLVIACAETDLLPIIEYSIRRYSVPLGKKSIKLKEELGKLPRVNIDRQRMERVFNSLIENAVEFTPQNGVITINARLEGIFVVVCVQDSGGGISEEILPMIFDKMRITLPASRRSGSRTGLSLPIARGIVEAHGGELSVRTEKGKGSEFTLKIPVTVS